MLEPSIYDPQRKLLGDVPPPPPLPKYDPSEEAPMWNYTRSKWSLPVEKPKPWTKVGVHPESDDDPDWRGVVRSKIIEIPMPESYDLNDFTDKPAYYFFDTPDYADPFKKLIWSSKYFLKTGIIIGLSVSLLQGKPAKLSTYLWMSHKYVIPWWFAGMAASSTVVTVANLRGKVDDYWNYAAAGQAAAMVFGRKSCLRWIQSTAICVPVAVFLKHAAETNTGLFPQWNFHKKSYGLSGMNNENGFWSGDLRFGFRARNYGDPGRDVRRPY